MGMRIGGGGSSWASYQNSSSVNSVQQRQQGAKNLFAALNAGDLTTAQSAFAALQQNNPNLSATPTSTTSSSATATGPFAAIGQALQAGDLAGAQKAAQNMQAARAGRHQHMGTGGRRNDGDADDVATSATSTAATTAQTTSSAAPVDAMTALNSFMQNLESALEQQVAGTSSATATTAATATDPTAAAATTTASLPYAATAQSVLWSRSNSVLSSATDAQLKTDLDNLIQQMTGASTTGSTPTNAATTTSSSSNTTGAALQNSFANLVGAFGGNSSSASVTSFLQNLEASLSNTASSASSISALA